MGNGSKAIRAIALSKRYGSVLAVDAISFEVQAGEVFGFLGPNGAGKTTTVRMLTTLLEPTAGTVIIAGHDARRQSYQARRQMGLVPEESNIYTELTAWDNLIFSARLYRVPAPTRERRAAELLQTFDLHEKRDVKVQLFSKGMRRRLTIAMALIHDPAVLFLDEPTSGLDVQSAQTIKRIVRELNAKGTTVFLTTHQIEEANQICDRVAIINRGRIVALDSPERLKRVLESAQAVEVAFAQAASVQDHELRRLPSVTEVVKLGDKWRLYTSDPAALLPVLFGLAETQSRRIISLNTLGPSLEDVFLYFTGQRAGSAKERGEGEAVGQRRRGGQGNV